MKAIPYLAAASVLALSACSAEPSERDIRKAFDASLKQATQDAAEAAAGFGLSADDMKEMMPELHGVKKIGCRAVEGTEGYICDVEIDMTAPMVGRQKDTGSVRLVKSSGSWRVLE
ncbi:MAG: hypothetical protein DIU62_013105 [Pseudomonadota bacterium]|jgi:hypothetical protein|nr:MAG: hypothetical protein DIU62_15035 [Pseudomonadota bacterium]